MKKPAQPKIGECCQFMSTKWGLVTGRVMGRDPNGVDLTVMFLNPDTKEVISPSYISVYDLVSDEDAVIHGDELRWEDDER